MDNKGSEIKVFLACDSIAAIIQFAWDYIANMNSVTVEDCKSYYEASDIGTVIILLYVDIHDITYENDHIDDFTHGYILCVVL